MSNVEYVDNKMLVTETVFDMIEVEIEIIEDKIEKLFKKNIDYNQNIKSIYDLSEITYLGFTKVILNLFKIKFSNTCLKATDWPVTGGGSGPKSKIPILTLFMMFEYKVECFIRAFFHTIFRYI